MTIQSFSTDIEYYAKNHNVHSYRFTVTGKDAEALKNLKAEIAKHNAWIRENARKRGKFEPNYWRNYSNLLRVKLEARGPRAIHARADFGPNRARAYDCSLPHRYATHYDVYVQVDGTANHRLKVEVEQGLTPGEQRKLEKLQREKWKIEINGQRRKQGLEPIQW